MRRTIPQLGHRIFDRQHRRIAELGTILRQRVASGQRVRPALTALLRATERHFASEERVMRLIGYRGLDGHRGLHQAVIHEMLGLRSILDGGLPLHRKHAAQVSDWLEHHVSEADRNLVDALLAGRRPG